MISVWEKRNSYQTVDHDNDPDYNPGLSVMEKKTIAAGQPMIIVRFDDGNEIIHRKAYNMENWPPQSLIDRFANMMARDLKRYIDNPENRKILDEAVKEMNPNNGSEH